MQKRVMVSSATKTMLAIKTAFRVGPLSLHIISNIVHTTMNICDIHERIQNSNFYFYFLGLQYKKNCPVAGGFHNFNKGNILDFIITAVSTA